MTLMAFPEMPLTVGEFQITRMQEIKVLSEGVLSPW